SKYQAATIGKCAPSAGKRAAFGVQKTTFNRHDMSPLGTRMLKVEIFEQPTMLSLKTHNAVFSVRTDSGHSHACTFEGNGRSDHDSGRQFINSGFQANDIPVPSAKQCAAQFQTIANRYKLARTRIPVQLIRFTEIRVALGSCSWQRSRFIWIF